jgi:Mce-associated membrane protein
MSTVVNDDTKICPYCAEEIKAAAIKCRYCQSDLTQDSDIGTPEVTNRSPSDIGAAGVSSGSRFNAVFGATRARLSGATKLTGRLPSVSMRMLVVLLALSLVAAVAAGWFAWNLRTMRAEDAARTAGQVTAANYLERILSYSYKTFDRDEAQQRKLTSGTFAKQYAHTMKMVRGSALRTHTVVKANVVASSIVSAQPDQVKALLFLNQTTTGDQVQQPRVDLNRVVVTLTKDGDGGWLVSQLDAL